MTKLTKNNLKTLQAIMRLMQKHYNYTKNDVKLYEKLETMIKEMEHDNYLKIKYGNALVGSHPLDNDDSLERNQDVSQQR